MTTLERSLRPKGFAVLHNDKACRLCKRIGQAVMEHYDSAGTFLCVESEWSECDRAIEARKRAEARKGAQ